MSTLVVLGFDDMFKAEEVLLALRKLQQQHLIDLEDAAVVVRQTDGTVRVKQAQNLVATGAATGAMGGGLWGMLIGLLFLNPLAGAVVGAGIGAGAGAATGALTDIGIDDAFIKATAETITPGTSALFVLVVKATPDRVIAEVQSYHPRVLHTSLSAQDEAGLRKVLEEKRIVHTS